MAYFRESINNHSFFFLTDHFRPCAGEAAGPFREPPAKGLERARRGGWTRLPPRREAGAVKWRGEKIREWLLKTSVESICLFLKESRVEMNPGQRPDEKAGKPEGRRTDHLGARKRSRSPEK